MERFRIKWALDFGPWRLTNEASEPGGPRLFKDAELEEHWREWARAEPRSFNCPEWDETCWAVRRFELGEESVEAFVACRRLDETREHTRRAACRAGLAG